jgi:Tfp pilus assembly protein PilW
MKAEFAFTNPGRRRGSPAFSLMELMLSVALLAVVITALLLVFEQTQRAFRGGNNQTDVLEGGRSTTQLLNRELQELTSAGDTSLVDLVIYTPASGAPLLQELPGGGERANELQRLTFLFGPASAGP